MSTPPQYLIDSGCVWKNTEGEWEYFDPQIGYCIYGIDSKDGKIYMDAQIGAEEYE